MAVFVMVSGPESSGNNLIRHMLAACGCADVSDDPSLEAPAVTEGNVVCVRSQPHGGVWVSLEELKKWIEHSNHEMRIVIPCRGERTCLLSQIERGHVETLAQGRQNYYHALSRVLNFALWANVAFVLVTYEELLASPRPTLEYLVQRLGLPPVDAEAIIANGTIYREARR